MRNILGLLLILFFSCTEQSEKKVSTFPAKDSVQSVKDREAKNDSTELQEFFVDSINIGRKKLNKIEISKYIKGDSNYVIIKFYSKQADKWHLKNEIHFDKDGITGCDTKISDFNNDGFNDMTLISTLAARGANEVRRLYIYDKNKDDIIFIKNSENYPNIRYNKDLKCVDAFLVYGGCSTVFLNISGDSLKEFASVTLYEGLTVRVYDKNGKEKIIQRDTTIDEAYTRYKNFRPLTENTEE